MSEHTRTIPAAAGRSARGDSEGARTGDLVIDAALSELLDLPVDDLDGQVAAGDRLQRTLHERLSDLGG